ncbi:MAG: hypothetical protein Q6370_020840 [Candidatus Sigynarchaeota archaeon]
MLQYFLELVIHQAKSTSSGRYFSNTNMSLVFVSCQQRKIIKTKLDFLLQFNALIHSATGERRSRETRSPFATPPATIPVDELDRLFLRAYKYYLEHRVFLSVNVSLSPGDLRTFFDLPVPLISSLHSIAPTIIDFQYYSIFWEHLWESSGGTGDAGPARDEWQYLPLLERALYKSRSLFAPLDLNEFDHPLITLFSQFNDENEDMKYSLQLARITDQVYEFVNIAPGSEVERIYVIDYLDWQQHNVFAYGRAFQELLFDDGDHDEIGFFIVDLTTRSIMQVDIRFFRRHLIGDPPGSEKMRAFRTKLADFRQRIENATMVAPFKLQLILRFSIPHVEYMLDGLGRVNFYPDFVEGILHAWRFEGDPEGFHEVEWNKEGYEKKEPNTSSGDQA